MIVLTESQVEQLELEKEKLSGVKYSRMIPEGLKTESKSVIIQKLGLATKTATKKGDLLECEFNTHTDLVKACCEDIVPQRIRDNDKGKQFILPEEVKSNPVFSHLVDFLDTLEVREVLKSEFPETVNFVTDYSHKEK